MSIPSGKTNSQIAKSVIYIENDRLRDKLHFDLMKLGHEVELPDYVFQSRDLDFSRSADYCFVDSHLLERSVRQSVSDEQASPVYISLWDFEDGSNWEMLSSDFQGLMLNRSYRIAELKVTLIHAKNMRELLAKHGQNDYAVEKRLENEIVGHSDAARQLRKLIADAISNDKPVMLLGEAGTGKRNIARLMHVANNRTNGSFIGYDCRNRPTNELLNRLEEYLRKAERESTSRSEDTIYIGHMEHIAERLKSRIFEVFERLSSYVEIIFGSTKEESRQRSETSFDDALAETLAAIVIELPPLRKRSEDIRSQARKYIEDVSIRVGFAVPRFTEDAFEALENYRWPGNSHELFSVCEQICSLISDGWITREIVEPWLTNSPEEETSTVSFTLREMEKRLIEATFHRFGGNREQTAGALKIGIRTLCGKLREYGYPPRGGPGSNKIEQQKAA